MDIKEVLTRTDGRISRSEFWLKGFVPLMVLMLILVAVDTVIGTNGILTLIGQIALIYPSVAIGIKRFHDRAKSGWWVLISLVPVIGGLWYLIECGFLKGTDGQNEYGPDPTK